MADKNPILTSLKKAQNLFYEPNNLQLKNLVLEKESQKYNACQFLLNNKQVLFRTAKTTPTKIGQFVTLWKRIGSGPIMPYDLSDSIDLFIISVKKSDNFGQFIFPKSVLHQHGVLSEQGVGGKRAIRVYAPWDNPISKQAVKTQAWQQPYFFEISKVIENNLMKKLIQMF